jgi:hypothetical protein
MRISTWIVAAALLCPVLAVHAQDSSTYKVDFTIRDTGDAGGKTGRKYSLLVNPGHKTTFKVGNRVPVTTAGTGGVGGNVQFTYIDVGMNIECTVGENNSRLMLRGDVDISTAVMPEKGVNAAPAPTISQIRLSLDTTVAPGKPTTVASFDDPVTSRKFDVDVTITKT